MRKLIGAFLLAISFTSCVKEEPYLNLSDTKISADQNGGEYVISVSSNNRWTASVTDKWCVLGNSSGKGSDNASTIKVTVNPNSSFEDRSCHINIKSGNLSLSVEVTQSGKYGILLDKSEFKLTSAAQSLIIPVSTNTSLSVLVPDDAKSWISQQVTKSLSSASIILSIAKNEGYDDRTATVTIKGGDDIDEPIIITQSQMDAFVLSEHVFELSSEEQIVEVQFKTNVSDYSIVISEDASSWISLSRNNGTKALEDKSVHFKILANPSGDKGREGMVTIKNKSGDTSETIVFSQRLTDILNPGWGSLIITGEEQVFTIPLSHNIDYDYEIIEGDSWLQTVDTKSVVTTDLYFAAKENTTGNAREGCIRFTNKDKGQSIDVTITQAIAGKGVVTLVTEGNSVPTFEFITKDAEWQFHWDNGTVSEVCGLEWPAYENSGTHTTKMIMSKSGKFTIKLTGVKVLDLRQL